jgi:hypothetical protein
MAFAPYPAPAKILGSFVEKDYEKIFEYTDNPELVLAPLAHGGKNVQFPHLVYVGPLQETRQALVKGTCVHIITDETEFGWVVEKWDIKKHRKYAA